MSGWISIHRRIEKHWLWSDKPFSKGQAWIDILMMVNHEEGKILIGNDLINIERGSKITSIRKLCERWGWSNTKVKNFLKLLEEEEMLVAKSDTKKTTLTVLNYNDYQRNRNGENDTKAFQERHESDTKAFQKHTNNNVNNDNNDNKDIKTLVEPKFNEETTEYQLAFSLYEKILLNDDKFKKPNLYKWAEDIDRLMRIDKRDAEEIKKIIDFVTTDEFWMTNVLSASKLRKQFPQLRLKAQDKKSTTFNRKKTGFHVEQQRTDNYSKSELEDVVARKRREAKKRMKGEN